MEISKIFSDNFLLIGTADSEFLGGGGGGSLVPRPFEEEEKGPGTHCVCMRYFPSKSWKFVFLSTYLSINVNLDLRCMPKNHFCWQRFGLKTPAVTNLAITSEQYRQKNNKESMRRTSTHV